MASSRKVGGPIIRLQNRVAANIRAADGGFEAAKKSPSDREGAKDLWAPSRCGESPRRIEQRGCPSVRGTQLTVSCVSLAERLVSVSLSTPFSRRACEADWSISDCSVKLRA